MLRELLVFRRNYRQPIHGEISPLTSQNAPHSQAFSASGAVAITAEKGTGTTLNSAACRRPKDGGAAGTRKVNGAKKHLTARCVVCSFRQNQHARFLIYQCRLPCTGDITAAPAYIGGVVCDACYHSVTTISSTGQVRVRHPSLQYFGGINIRPIVERSGKSRFSATLRARYR